MTAPAQALTTLTAGMAIPFGGDRLTTVDAHPAAAFVGRDSVGLAVPRGVGEFRVAARLALDRLELGADQVAQLLEPGARGGLLFV